MFVLSAVFFCAVGSSAEVGAIFTEKNLFKLFFAVAGGVLRPTVFEEDSGKRRKQLNINDIDFPPQRCALFLSNLKNKVRLLSDATADVPHKQQLKETATDPGKVMLNIEKLRYPSHSHMLQTFLIFFTAFQNDPSGRVRRFTFFEFLQLWSRVLVQD